MLKAYKTYTAALRANQDKGYIVRLGLVRGHVLYVIGMSEIDDISIIFPSRGITGSVIVRHLERLGNANLANPDQNEASAIRARELRSSSNTTEKQN
jgi:hypothetical protein